MKDLPEIPFVQTTKDRSDAELYRILIQLHLKNRNKLDDQRALARDQNRMIRQGVILP